MVDLLGNDSKYTMAPLWGDNILKSLHGVNLNNLTDWFALSMNDQLIGQW